MPQRDQSHTASREQLRTLAKGLGWFSIALGTLELLAPRRTSREIGMHDQSSLVHVYGAREIATGVGILASRDPTPWIWGRVAGDVIDAVSLLPAATTPGRKQGAAMASLAAVAGVMLIDAYCARQLSQRQEDAASAKAPASLASARARRKATGAPRDYSSRSGFPKPAEQMRGAARDTFRTPDAYRSEVVRADTPRNESWRAGR